MGLQGLRYEACQGQATSEAASEGRGEEVRFDRHPRRHLLEPLRWTVETVPRRHPAAPADIHRRWRLPAALALAQRARALVAPQGIPLRDRGPQSRHPREANGCEESLFQGRARQGLGFGRFGSLSLRLPLWLGLRGRLGGDRPGLDRRREPAALGVCRRACLFVARRRGVGARRSL